MFDGKKRAYWRDRYYALATAADTLGGTDLRNAVTFCGALVLAKMKMLPSGSVRPLQPMRNIW